MLYSGEPARLMTIPDVDNPEKEYKGNHTRMFYKDRPEVDGKTRLKALQPQNVAERDGAVPRFVRRAVV